jgi:hypothetical protein
MTTTGPCLPLLSPIKGCRAGPKIARAERLQSLLPLSIFERGGDVSRSLPDPTVVPLFGRKRRQRRGRSTSDRLENREGNGASDVVKSAKKRQKAPRPESTSTSYKSQLGIDLRSREPSQSMRAPNSARGRSTESIQRGLRLGARVGSHALARFESKVLFRLFFSPSKACGPRRFPRPAPFQSEFALNYAGCHSRAASPQFLLR